MDLNTIKQVRSQLSSYVRNKILKTVIIVPLSEWQYKGTHDYIIIIIIPEAFSFAMPSLVKRDQESISIFTTEIT